MSKNSVATVHLVNRGGYLFLSVCWRGNRKYKSLGFKCDERYWNCKKEVCMAGCPNHRTINVNITKAKMDVIERINKFVISGQPYTVDMVLEEDVVKDLNGVGLSFSGLVDELIEEKQLRYNSSRLYRYAMNRLFGFLNRKDILVSEVDNAMMNKFSKQLKSDGVTVGSISTILKKIKAVVNFAISKGVIDNSKYNQSIEGGSSVSNVRGILDRFQIDMLFKWYLDYMLEPGYESGMWRYNGDSFINLATDRTSIECRVGIFLFSFLCQGLSPVDCALLRREDISMVQVGDDMFYQIQTSRLKTGRDVKILVKKEMKSLVLFQSLLGVGTGYYLFPVFDESLRDNEKKRVNCLNCFLNRSVKVLRDVMREVNKRIIQYNIDNDKNEKLIDVENISYYSSRHSFASLLVNSNISLNGIASLMGRSIRGLEVYIHQLTDNDDIAKIREKAGL